MANERTCGGCTVCCKLPGIDDEKLKKPVNTWCQFCDVKKSKPCTIYETRPDTCRTFQCLWLSDDAGALKDDMRPDRSKMMLTSFVTNIGVLPEDTIMAWEVYPGSLDSKKNQRVIAALSTKIPVLIMYLGGGRRIIGPPDRMAEISRRVNQAIIGRAKRMKDGTGDGDQGKASE